MPPTPCYCPSRCSPPAASSWSASLHPARSRPWVPPTYVALIERALRDEDTSYHYLPASGYAEADPALVAAVSEALADVGEPVERGATWTTDAPFRETATAIKAARKKGILAIEMETALLCLLRRRGASRSCVLPT